jgi:hypothetical protein
VSEEREKQAKRVLSERAKRVLRNGESEMLPDIPAPRPSPEEKRDAERVDREG